jgi:hypothetical protein
MYFFYRNYAFDPDMAPRGKSVLLSMFLSEWSHWEKLKGDPAAYKAEKERTAEECIGALETRYPGIRTKVEMVDVATPLTYERYTGNWKGTHMTWQPNPEFERRHRFIPKTVPGLEGFYLASMWTNAPGGLPGAADAGRGVAQLLCARDRKRFVTTSRRLVPSRRQAGSEDRGGLAASCGRTTDYATPFFRKHPFGGKYPESGCLRRQFSERSDSPRPAAFYSLSAFFSMAPSISPGTIEVSARWRS